MSLWRRIEFGVLYLGSPLAIALFLPPGQLFPALGLLMLAGLVLLWRTGGFDWRSLWRGRIRPRALILMALACALTGTALLSVTAPEALFRFLRINPAFLPIIWVFYPILSALPQELIFRPLFFHRYGALFETERAAVLTNAAVFSLAHLMYWSAVVAVMTFIGGLIFACAYRRDGFPAAWALHAIAGNVLFTVGMGVYFYSGNVVRPF